MPQLFHHLSKLDLELDEILKGEATDQMYASFED